MAYESPPAPGGQIVGTHLAAADLSPAGATPAQYRFVKQNGAGQIVRCSVAGEAAFAVLQNRPLAARACTLWRSGGVSKMVAGAAIVLGAEVTTDNQGRAIPAATGHLVHGIAETAAAAAGEMVSISLQPGRIVP